MSDEKYAAQRRAEHVAALKAERDGYVVRGLSERVAAVEAEIARFEGKPAGRRKPSASKD